MCHEFARKEKNGRRRNRDESTARDRDILWKTSCLSSTGHNQPPRGERNPHEYGVTRSIHRQAVPWHGGVALMMRRFL
jgi:hypothetical protein